MRSTLYADSERYEIDETACRNRPPDSILVRSRNPRKRPRRPAGFPRRRVPRPRQCPGSFEAARSSRAPATRSPCTGRPTARDAMSRCGGHRGISHIGRSGPECTARAATRPGEGLLRGARSAVRPSTGSERPLCDRIDGFVPPRFSMLGGRSTVGPVALNHVIGVRIPASQPDKSFPINLLRARSETTRPAFDPMLDRNLTESHAVRGRALACYATAASWKMFALL